MRPIQKTYHDRTTQFERKEQTVKSDVLDLMASIIGSSYNKEEKLKLLDSVKLELETAYTKI